jgi:hypothetical protein
MCYLDDLTHLTIQRFPSHKSIPRSLWDEKDIVGLTLETEEYAGLSSDYHEAGDSDRKAFSPIQYSWHDFEYSHSFRPFDN